MKEIQSKKYDCVRKTGKVLDAYKMGKRTVIHLIENDDRPWLFRANAKALCGATPTVPWSQVNGILMPNCKKCILKSGVLHGQ